jgi:hypothetical protein
MAQPIDTTQRRLSDVELGHQYLKKSKSQKTAAWILLGAGTIGVIASAAVITDNYYESSGTGSEAIYFLSSMSMIASVPLFITAAKNKGRAEILLRYENVPLSRYQPSVKGVPALGIRIPLGRNSASITTVR